MIAETTEVKRTVASGGHAVVAEVGVEFKTTRVLEHRYQRKVDSLHVVGTSISTKTIHTRVGQDARPTKPRSVARGANKRTWAEMIIEEMLVACKLMMRNRSVR